MDYRTIIKQLVDGKVATGLTPMQRKLWPRFAYHFTDINNAVNILDSGLLLSRRQSIAQNEMVNDNASTDVINGTDDFVADYVRLYFRPKTPTQYNNEGVKVSALRGGLDANCPVPIFFLFDLPKLLLQPGVQFSDRSLAIHEHVNLYSTPDEFSKLPFESIYHNRALFNISEKEKRDIIRHRHAEIIVKDQLDLTDLSRILVRSVAEQETLLNLLHDRNITKYDDIIKIGTQDFFFKDRNFVDSVELTDKEILLKNVTNRPFPEDWGNTDSSKVLFAQNEENTDWYLNLTVRIDYPNGSYVVWPDANKRALFLDKIALQFNDPVDSYRVTVKIDGHIAYLGTYEKNLAIMDELPF
ncbi:DarT ssDNA thymidine ADP-ribosyltransferase family protein [Loigolactobacillus iwatensis]|uniref:DarT ssDNA thymidine ADP-ribosyltransferase family protein n=1 Tax=Loigolactobacillus iwatensis TaxID=1267156 RepID=UPI000F7F535D|nr:DarT ssDNA thymidine ADP-ribosyltransferase family protein [Loigolactobacillus iwatensis]